jgi:hypothetical protein
MPAAQREKEEKGEVNEKIRDKSDAGEGGAG